jgi:sugar O-acyltransferase (sialic acid O-acetyltransferase NeuD family)
MTDFLAVRMPQSGPNDATATLVEWNKASGQPVHKGEIVATAETTKSIFEIEAPAGGYLTALAALGDEVAIGAVIAALSAEPVTIEQARAWGAALETPSVPAAPAGAKGWTVKAELLAQRHGIMVADVPAAGERVTEADVQAYLDERRRRPAAAPPAAAADLVDDRYPQGRIQRLLIVGGGNGAVQILDVLARRAHQRAVAIVDDNAALHGKRIAGVPIVGAIDADRAAELLAAGEFDAAVISVSTSIPFRARVFSEWQARGIPFANVIHPSAVVGMNVQWGAGNVVMALCHIGACAVIGDNNFVSACCSIEHHNVLGSHCSFGPAVVTSSRVRIGDRVRFGTGIFVEPGVEIGADSVIASGLALTQHVPERSLVKAKVGYTIRRR